MKKRWYDRDATVSLAVSLIQNTSPDIQRTCADMIISKAQDMGVSLEHGIVDAIGYVMLRWYDANEKLSTAFEYLRQSDDDLKKDIALEIIAFLEKAETKDEVL